MDRKNKLTHSQAMAEWELMTKNPKTHYHDKKGPNNSYRFRVSVKDIVTFRSAVKHGRQLESSFGQVKAQRHKWYRRVLFRRRRVERPCPCDGCEWQRHDVRQWGF